MVSINLDVLFFVSASLHLRQHLLPTFLLERSPVSVYEDAMVFGALVQIFGPTKYVVPLLHARAGGDSPNVFQIR